MLKKATEYVTTLEVIQAMGVEPEDWLVTRVGCLTQAWWRRLTGNQPDKDLAPKKKDPKATHCRAYYPAEVGVPVIEGFVRMCKFERARQGDLFRPPDIEFEEPESE